MNGHFGRLAAGLVAGLALLLLPFSASAQDNPGYECDNSFGQCGTPNQSGGGGCGCGGGSILINNTDLGDTYQYADDYDNDGVEDPYDNCPRFDNPLQADADGDGVGDGCDNCLNSPNELQFDLDGDSLGDVCDDDIDGDDILNLEDNCATVPNPITAQNAKQVDLDGDGLGDACDDDIDGDGMLNLEDPCPLNASIAVPTAEQQSLCFPDIDGDGVSEVDPVKADNCPTIYNNDQSDIDLDGMGDLCDPDMDGDGIANQIDNCELDVNEDQLDADRDQLGDSCDNHFCFVVLGDEDNCLDPAAPLTVYSPDVLTNTGDKFRLRLFANRQNQAMRYTWSVIESPAGSHARMDAPTGTVTVSTPYEYHYLSDSVAAFVADKPGEYKVRVVAETVWEDRVTNKLNESAEWVVTITANGDTVDLGADGEEEAAGCSAAGDATAQIGFVALMLLALGALIWRRRETEV